jgi:hypothetical protein
MPLLVLLPSAVGGGGGVGPVSDGVETTVTWANLLREAKAVPDQDDVRVGTPPSMVPPRRSLYD